MNTEPESKFTDIQEEIKRVGGLYLDAARFTAAEKVAVLLSATALGLLLLALGMAALLFCTMCVVHLLAAVIPIYWVYLIMATLFVILIVGIYLLRTMLIINPVARFVSRLFLNPPKTPKNEQ